MSETFKLGAGKSEIILEAGCLPSDGFIGVHDPLQARVLAFETGEGSAARRYAILSLDLTNMFPGAIGDYKALLAERTGAAPEDSWVAVTHNFTTPHLWEVPAPGQPDIPRPGHPARTEAEIERSRRVNMAFYRAAEQAAGQAAANLRPAVFGSGQGTCLVNASRNMETKEGWWLGCDDGEFSDHTVPVLKFETPEGEPLALLYTYDCQSSVMGKSELSTGGKLITSDLLGCASSYVERAYSGPFVALALCGAAGDQEPRLKANRSETDPQGRLRTVDMGEAGFALLEAQAARLGAELVKASKRIPCTETAVRSGRRAFLCQGQRMERDLRRLRPTRSYTYVPEGTKAAEVQAFAFGSFALVGTKAELASLTAAELRAASPFAHTAVATMVDGAAKYMVDAAAYDRFQYGAMNSGFAKGSAERLRDEAAALLKELRQACAP